MKKKDNLRRSDNGIEEVQTGLDTARLKLRYTDTGALVRADEYCFKISIPTAIGEDDFYFESYGKAQRYLKDFE